MLKQVGLFLALKLKLIVFHHVHIHRKDDFPEEVEDRKLSLLSVMNVFGSCDHLVERLDVHIGSVRQSFGQVHLADVLLEELLVEQESFPDAISRRLRMQPLSQEPNDEKRPLTLQKIDELLHHLGPLERLHILLIDLGHLDTPICDEVHFLRVFYLKLLVVEDLVDLILVLLFLVVLGTVVEDRVRDQLGFGIFDVARVK